MQVIPVTRNELALSTDDWKRLSTLMDDFYKVCYNQSCESCPLRNFCCDNPSPGDYLEQLYKFLDDYPKEGE